MSTVFFTRFGFSLLMVSATLSAAFGQTQNSVRFSSPPTEGGDRWQTTPWSRTDPMAIQWKALRSGKKPDPTTVRAMNVILDAKGTPSHLLFREINSFLTRPGQAYEMAYYAYERETATPSQRMPSPLMVAAHVMAAHPQNDSAEFARLRFVIESRVWTSYNLISVGRRLVDRFPQQPGLQMHLAVGLGFQKDSKSQDEAIRIAERLHRAYPKDTDFLGTLADIYSFAGLPRKDHKLLKRAAEAYQQLLNDPQLPKPQREKVKVRLEAVRSAMR